MANTNDVLEFLSKNGISVTEETTSQYVIDCPSCGRENKVYMGKSNGVWDCKVCSAKGNIHTYKNFAKVEQAKDTLISRTTVDRYCALLRGNVKAQQYLEDRDFTAQAVISEQIGCNEKGDIAIPFYTAKKELCAIKYRNLNFESEVVTYDNLKSQNIESNKPRKWYSVGQPGLWGVDKLDLTKPVILTEGEWDRIALIEMGIGNVAAVPGATNRNWLDDVKQAKTIYIAFDNDEAGHNGAFELASRLGLGRCYKITLPESFKDCNEALQGGFSGEQFRELVQSATMFPVSGISDTEVFMDLVMDDLNNPNKRKGAGTGFPKLDEITKGFSSQELRVVSGLSGTGKTTWTLLEMLGYAQAGLPVAIFSLETPVKDAIKLMLKHVQEQTTHKDIQDAIKYLVNLPIKWFDTRNFEHAFSINKFKELVQQARDRYGVKYVVLDDLDFLVTSSPKYQNENELISCLMTELKNMANNLNLHIVVIAHIIKASGDSLPRMRDIKGSGSIYQRSDYVMFVHRELAPDADDSLKADVTIVIEKNRPTGETAVLHYHYDKDTKTYRED